MGDQARYQLTYFSDGASLEGTFDELCGDYDFDSMDEVELVQQLPVGEEYRVKGYATWRRLS